MHSDQAYYPRAHTTTAASNLSASATSDSANAESIDQDSAWSSEPRTLDDLEARYDVLHTFPGRNANTVLKIVAAAEKGQEQAKNVCEGQQHKLFVVSGSEVKSTTLLQKPPVAIYVINLEVKSTSFLPKPRVAVYAINLASGLQQRCDPAEDRVSVGTRQIIVSVRAEGAEAHGAGR